MNKSFYLLFSIIFLLVGCNTTTESTGQNTLFHSNHEFSHDMEGVNVKLTYHVHQLQNLSEIEEQNGIELNSIILEGQVNLHNNTDRTIYYTPSFYAVSDSGKRFDNTANSLGIENVETPIILKAGEQAQFLIAFNLPDAVYKTIETLDVTVPVPFKEPNSISSGDALGDTTVWTIPIK